MSYTRASTFHTTQTLPPSSNNNTPKHRSDFHKKTVFANFSQNKQTPNSSIQHLQSTLKIKSAINILFLDAPSHRIADRVSFNDTIAPSFPDQSFKEMIQIVQGKTRHTNKNTHSMNNCSMNENTVKLDASSLASAQSIKMKDAGFNSGLNVVKNGIIPTFGMTLEHNHSSFSYKQSSFDYMQSVNKNFKESSTHSGNKCSKLELNENKIGYLHELFGVLNPINENDDIQTQSNVIRTTTLENVVKKESKKAQSYRSKQTGRVFLTNLNQTLYNDSFSNTSKSSSRSQNTRKVNIHSVKSIVYSCYNGNINLQVMNARNKCDDRYSRFGGNEQILLIRKDECSSMTRKSPIYHHTYVLEVQLDKLFDSSLKSYPINDTNSPSFSQYLTNKGIEAGYFFKLLIFIDLFRNFESTFKFIQQTARGIP